MFYVGTWNTGHGWVFLILYVRTLIVRVWILLACVRGFYDRKGGHFNELLQNRNKTGKTFPMAL